MASSNSNIQLADLDFNNIKDNLKTYLKSQNTLKDYNYEGSALSVLLDILAYNTQYNSFYLNMVGNEMFLDSALMRSSVVSHAKLLNYVPKSAIAPEATINLTVNQVDTTSLTVPKFTPFLSEAIDGVNYTFVTTDSYTVNASANTAIFNNLPIKQGIPTTLSFTVDTVTNPKYFFEIPDDNVDTSSISVRVQQSSTNSTSETYDLATNLLSLDGDSRVYFLQENLNEKYEIYFGDDILGKKLSDGNLVIISYIKTNGTLSAGANNFVLMNTIGGYSNTVVSSVTQASSGGEKESIESIKYQAPKSYASQGRAVTKEDYINAIQKNSLGISFDSVNVWGGEENSPPIYGQVFICLKPQGGYTLTQTQKQRLINEVIKPISVMTVEPTIIEPDYTYIKVNASVLYDSKKTTNTSSQIQQLITNAINNFSVETLNTFNSTFLETELNNAILATDSSIITSQIKIQLQKKFFPNLTTPTTYTLDYNIPLEKGISTSGVTSYPGLIFKNPKNITTSISGVYIEEVPSFTGGVESIQLLNPGFNYFDKPTVTILGDGTGATAEAVLNGNGSIKEIRVTNKGTGYTSAIVTITSATNNQGQLAAAAAILEGRFGTLRTYYNNTQNVKTILDSNVGTIDYQKGIVTLNSFNPLNIDDPLGQLTVNVKPTTSVISSSYNKIITVDPYDPTSITVNVTAK